MNRRQVETKNQPFTESVALFLLHHRNRFTTMSNPGRKPGFHTKWLKCGLTLVSLRRFYFHYFILTIHLIASKSSSSYYTLKNPHKIMNAVVLVHIFTTFTFTPLPPTNSPLASLAFLGDKIKEKN